MDVRSIAPEELESFYASFMRTMGFGPPADEWFEREKKSFQYPRSVAAFDAGTIVGTTYSHLFDLTLPGGNQIEAAGVTAVSVSSTHRRRGIVTDLMRRQLLEAHERDEPAAILIASEGRIYRRFGYGIATQVADVRIEVRDARVEHRTHEGRVVIVDGEAADKIFPAVHQEMVRGRAGALGRPRHFWESMTADRNKKTVNVVRENAAGEPDGYAIYDVKADWKDGLPAHALSLHALNGTNDAASFELWTYILGIDLVREVKAFSRPTDEPLRWVLDEPRAVRSTSVRDMYWLRPLDIARVLGSRTYSTETELRLHVDDPLLGLGGTFALKGGPDGAECARTEGAADLRLGVSELGSIALGGTTPTELFRAGRIEEVTPGAVARAEMGFLTSPRPWGDTYF
jgi:predicted acetyltransferase